MTDPLPLISQLVQQLGTLVRSNFHRGPELAILRARKRLLRRRTDRILIEAHVGNRRRAELRPPARGLFEEIHV